MHTRWYLLVSVSIVPTSIMSSIHMVTVSAPTNIAVIKYWGKDADGAALHIPLNSSVSVTLDTNDLCAITTVATSPSFTEDKLWLNGELDEGASTNRRFRACVDGMKAMAQEVVDSEGKVIIRKEDWPNLKIHVSSYNTFPTAAGLASSAAGYAALVFALGKLMNAPEDYSAWSTLARQGSGSACRSLFGGFVAWRKGSVDEPMTSRAEQVADETHWPEMRALILVVSDKKKDTSSTSGMATSVKTSPLLAHRAKEIVAARMELMEQAWLTKDFAAFGELTMKDSNQFHATCLDTYPPIFYLNGTSQQIIRLVHVYNEWAGAVRAAYTFDAGPNAVLYVLEKDVVEVGALMLHYFPEFGEKYINRSDFADKAKAYELPADLVAACDQVGRVPQAGDVQSFYLTQAGAGPQVLSDICNLDATTGENCYKP